VASGAALHGEDMTNPTTNGKTTNLSPTTALLLAATAALGAACDDAGDSGPRERDQLAAHVALVEARIEASNRHDWAAWQAMHTDDAVRTAPELPGPLVSSAAMRAGIEELVVTFPDYHLELVDAFGQGDRLMARIHTRATMLGAMQLGETTIPPTGLAFEQDWVAVLTFEGDRISAIDEFHDNYTILLQLGLASMP
jgi:ketosteroid isomerase-like protein